MFAELLKRSLMAGFIFGVIGFIIVIATAPSFLGVLWITAGSFMVVVGWVAIGIVLSIILNISKGRFFKKSPNVVELNEE